MIVLPTAKILLFIAFNLGPHQCVGPFTPRAIRKTTCLDATQTGWTVEAKGFPASDFTRDPSHKRDLAGNQDLRESVPTYLRAISQSRLEPQLRHGF